MSEPVPQQPDGRRHQRQAGEQPLGRREAALLLAAHGAAARVPGDPLAPQRRRQAVPRAGHRTEVRTRRRRRERPHHHAGRGQLLLHALDPDRRVLRRQLDGGHQFGPAQLAGHLQPPQRQQCPVVGVQPAGRLGDLAALPRQAQAQDGQVHEVAAGIGVLADLVERRRGGAPGVPAADLVERYGHEPRPEGGGITQSVQPVDRAQHGLLHDVVDVGVPAERPADHVVHQRQAGRDQLVPRPQIPRLRGDHQGRPVLVLHAHPTLSTDRPARALRASNAKCATPRHSPCLGDPAARRG